MPHELVWAEDTTLVWETPNGERVRVCYCSTVSPLWKWSIHANNTCREGSTPTKEEALSIVEEMVGTERVILRETVYHSARYYGKLCGYVIKTGDQYLVIILPENMTINTFPHKEQVPSLEEAKFLLQRGLSGL